MLVAAIARAFLAGPMEAGAATERAARAMGETPAWLPGLALRFVERFAGVLRPRYRDVLRFLRAERFLDGVETVPEVVHWLTEAPEMRPLIDWGVPQILTVGDLAEWAGVTVGELEWLADLKGLARPGHYHYQTVAKQSGAVRLLEAPKARLKELQRRILREILERVPGHEAAHGFRAGRSARTFAAVHAGQRVVLRMDMRDFFPSIGRSRVQAIFRMMGYPEAVADLLGGLCTNAAPEGGPLYERPHLPQGAPTSPALANLCFYKADCRLAGLARAAGLRYARYADDLAFSGDSIAEALRDRVGAIVLEEGYCLQYRKTRLMPRGVRQKLVGLVVNARPNVDRESFDLLKATLHRCVVRGPGEESREQLLGRISWVESGNAGRGRKLRALWDRIDWGTRG